MPVGLEEKRGGAGLLHWRRSQAFGGHVLEAEVTCAGSFLDMECFESRSQAMFETCCTVLTRPIAH